MQIRVAAGWEVLETLVLVVHVWWLEHQIKSYCGFKFIFPGC
jgi:hypothetical protein